MARDCGSCSVCCKLLRVPDIDKPSGMVCWWTTVHGGCTRQAEKPDPTRVEFDAETGIFSLPADQEGKDLALLACAQFQCLWLASQARSESEVMPRHWRPDWSHVLLGPKDKDNDLLLHVHVDPEHPSAWKEPEIYGYLCRMVERGCEVEINVGEQRFLLEIGS